MTQKQIKIDEYERIYINPESGTSKEPATFKAIFGQDSFYLRQINLEDELRHKVISAARAANKIKYLVEFEKNMEEFFRVESVLYGRYTIE